MRLDLVDIIGPTVGEEIHDVDGAHLSDAMGAVLGLDERAGGPVPGSGRVKVG